MEKLTIKELACYLPYGLKVTKDDWGKVFKMDNDGTTLNCVGIDYILNVEAKPILRNLSDLTKEIEVNGERFVPALRLAEISVECGIYQDIAPSIEFKYSIKNKPFGKILKVTKLDEWVIMLSFNEPERLKYIFYEKLLEWHFDTKGLIEKGLAIDLNTLNQKQ